METQQGEMTGLFSVRIIDEEIFETCAVCGGPTTVRKDEPRDETKYFFEGIGYICESCAIEH